jgi:hypothetical protein
MLIDFRRKFLFIKTNKTAGTSIEIALSKVMDVAHSVITPITAEDECLRSIVGGQGPCGYQRGSLCELAWEAMRQAGHVEPLDFFNHIGYQEVVKYLGLRLVKNLWSFGFTRHPYDRALSIYTYRHRGAPGFSVLPLSLHQKSFEMMLRSGILFSTSRLLGSRAPEQVDKIFLYEDLGGARDMCCSGA